MELKNYMNKLVQSVNKINKKGKLVFLFVFFCYNLLYKERKNMNNEDEIIEILDDFEDITTTSISNVNNTVSMEKVATNDVSFEPDKINLGVSVSEELNQKVQIPNEVKNLEEVKYEPIKPEKDNIKIESNDMTEEDSKSGLGFVIVLFILLVLFIMALPYISQLF